MTVTRDADGIVRLVGHCPAEDAEGLLRILDAAPGATVDWRECTWAHTAVVQVLLALRPALTGPPADAFLAQHVMPILL